VWESWVRGQSGCRECEARQGVVGAGPVWESWVRGQSGSRGCEVRVGVVGARPVWESWVRGQSGSRGCEARVENCACEASHGADRTREGGGSGKKAGGTDAGGDSSVRAGASVGARTPNRTSEQRAHAKPDEGTERAHTHNQTRARSAHAYTCARVTNSPTPLTPLPPPSLQHAAPTSTRQVTTRGPRMPHVRRDRSPSWLRLVSVPCHTGSAAEGTDDAATTRPAIPACATLRVQNTKERVRRHEPQRTGAHVHCPTASGPLRPPISPR
jgi:hypothetical protein